MLGNSLMGQRMKGIAIGHKWIVLILSVRYPIQGQYVSRGALGDTG